MIILLGALIVREKTMPLEYACSACDFSYKVSGNLNICAAWWALSEAPLIKQVSHLLTERAVDGEIFVNLLLPH